MDDLKKFKSTIFFVLPVKFVFATLHFPLILFLSKFCYEDTAPEKVYNNSLPYFGPFHSSQDNFDTRKTY